MQADKYKNYTATDFLKDKDFIRWQLFNGEEDMLFWNDVVEKYPFLTLPIEEAVILYKDNIRFNDFSMSRPEISECIISLQNQICYKKKRRTSKRIVLSISAIAASVAIIISLPLLFDKGNNVQDISTFARTLPDNSDFYSSDTKLILSENNTVVLNNKESSIQYEEDGIKADDNLILKEESAPYNQLITPYGKRSVITFSDGTKAWVNAGSRLVYPAEFNKGKREIYVDGEIYVEVCEDKKRPFVIKTSQMDIEVLGTKFNVSAYEADKTNSVVLLSGSVSISSNSRNKNIILKPDQMYSDIKGSHTVENVDASIYILWTQGLYQFESEKLANIVTRLERYYGIRIECDAAITELKCSGKLDLKDDMNKLLDELSRALPITYRKNNDGSYTINTIS
ncbi:FecR protein [Proteiniphilum saccharofermentans]|uniref:FecR protein n=1 Tax=Proteiniphilum saccharofermentans TaxID=1642647 RepID=A0A1R3TBF0_9BACT|nr:FecR domain-containing protein [Proteiniphilum saccharofermentans]SCD21305.1 FecR protein [Proteiniphilum saccharofermentans]